MTGRLQGKLKDETREKRGFYRSYRPDIRRGGPIYNAGWLLSMRTATAVNVAKVLKDGRNLILENILPLYELRRFQDKAFINSAKGKSSFGTFSSRRGNGTVRCFKGIFDCRTAQQEPWAACNWLAQEERKGCKDRAPPLF